MDYKGVCDFQIRYIIYTHYIFALFLFLLLCTRWHGMKLHIVRYSSLPSFGKESYECYFLYLIFITTIRRIRLDVKDNVCVSCQNQQLSFVFVFESNGKLLDLDVLDYGY